MGIQYTDIFTRNIGLFTEAEQEIIKKSKVAIAGVGGIGGLVAERLIRLGVENLKFTDPGDMEASNLNRQFGSSALNIGKNKAEVVYEQIKDINPEAKIKYSKTGIIKEGDADLLTEDCDVLIDVMDFGLFKQSIWLQRAARRKGIHYLFSTAIGFGAIAVVFDPKGMTLEEYNGLPVDVDLNGPSQPFVPMGKIVPVMPAYVNDIRMVQDIIAGKSPVPTSSIGAGLAAILSASEAVNVILGKYSPKAPQYIFFDVVDRQMVVAKIQ